MIVFISFIIPVFSFFLQSYPRFINKYFGVDVWTRLLEIEHVQKAHHKIPGKITKGFIIDGYFDYPIVFPWIFSFFKKNTLLKLQGFVSPFFDAVQNILVYFIAYSLTGNIGISLVAQIVYSLIPMIPVENSYLTPRSLGYLLFTLSFYPLLVFNTTHMNLYLFLSILFSILLFLTHRFALQSYLFICIFFAFFDRSLWYIAVPLIAGAGAIILTGGYYLRVAKGHWSNIYFWVVNYRYRFAHQIYGNKQQKKQDWVGKIYGLLSTFSPIFLFGMDIWIVSAFIFLFYYLQVLIQFPNELLLFKMSIWILFFYVFGAVVLKIKRLIPIGEGQRYLEMATVPTAILSSVLVFTLYKQFGIIAPIFFALVALGNLGLILFIQIKGIIQDKNRSLTPDLEDMFSYIQKMKPTPRIMCIPHQITTMTVYHTHADVLVNADNPGLLKLSDFFPILKKNISDVAKKYNLTYLLLRENFATVKDLKLKNPKIIHRSGNIVLIKL